MIATKEKQVGGIQKFSWNTIEKEKFSDFLTRQAVYGEKGTMAQFSFKRGGVAARHSHANEEYMSVVSGAIKLTLDDREIVVRAGEGLVIPPNLPHAMLALEDGVFLEFFTPAREDWLRGEDQYLRP